MVRLQDLISNSAIDHSVNSIQLTAVIDSALCVGAGGSTGSLSDKPIVRNGRGQLLIPGSQLKGRLRHECEKIARALGWQVFDSPGARGLYPQDTDGGGHFKAVEGFLGHHCIISRIFGNPVLPSLIIVEDLICPLAKEELAEVLRPGVTINRRRRTAEDQKLYFLETSPANAQLEFSGAIYLQADCPEYAKPLLLSGLHHIHALGGGKSVGLGWLTWQAIETTLPNNSAWEALTRKGGNNAAS